MARSILDRLIEMITNVLAGSAEDGAGDRLRKPAAVLAEAAEMIARPRANPLPAGVDADEAARYGECRKAYDELVALCADIHVERDGVFEPARREWVARGIEAVKIVAADDLKALRDGYVALLRDARPWQVALERLLPRVKDAHEFAKRVDAAATGAVKDASLMQEPSLQHVRATGVKAAQAWLQEELVSGRRGQPPAFDEDIAAVDDARRTATFLFRKARAAWHDHAARTRADFEVRVKQYRELVSLVECARRSERLEDALADLVQWLVGGAVGAPPGKRNKEGVTARLFAKLDAAARASESLRRAQALVDALDEWLTVIVTQLPVVVPVAIAFLLVALTASTVTRLSTRGAGVLDVGWEFFNLAHPERLVALLATMVVALLFFAAQLESVRRRARTLGWWGLGGFLVLLFALPAGSAIAMKRWLQRIDMGPAWDAVYGELVAKGYDCRRGFRPDDRLGDFVVLSCDGSCGHDGGSSLFLPRERLAALEVLAGGVCFRLQDDRTAPPGQDAGLAAIAAAIREVGPAQVRVEVPPPDAQAIATLAGALGHVGDALASKKAGNITMSRDMDAAIKEYLRQSATWNTALTSGLGAIGGSLGEATLATGAELRLSNCRQSHRLKTTWMGRRAEDWNGIGDDPCYREYVAALAERSDRTKALAERAANPSQEAGHGGMK